MEKISATALMSMDAVSQAAHIRKVQDSRRINLPPAPTPEQIQECLVFLAEDLGIDMTEGQFYSIMQFYPMVMMDIARGNPELCHLDQVEDVVLDYFLGCKWPEPSEPGAIPGPLLDLLHQQVRQQGFNVVQVPT